MQMVRRPISTPHAFARADGIGGIRHATKSCQGLCCLVVQADVRIRTRVTGGTSRGVSQGVSQGMSCLHDYMLTCLHAQDVYMLTCSRCLHAYMLKMLTCLHAYMLKMFTCYMLTCSITYAQAGIHTYTCADTPTQHTHTQIHRHEDTRIKRNGRCS